MVEKVEIDDEVWTVKEIKDGLPIFINEDDKECLYDFDIDDEYALEMEEYRRLQREMGYDIDDDYEDIMNKLYERLLYETENDEWVNTFEKLRDKAETDRRLKARADEWYASLETVNYEEAEEGKELPIDYFDEFQKEYMLNHQDEVKEKLEWWFGYEVVDWWFDDEPFHSLEGEGHYFYDVWDIWVKFGKKIED